MRKYVLSRNLVSRLGDSSRLCCRVCGGELHVGDEVVSVSSNRRAKLYHVVCFKLLFVDA